MKRIFPAVKLRTQTPHIDKREIGDAAIPGGKQNTYFSLNPPPPTRAISQWARSLEWRHAVTLHILFGKICISFLLFYCEGMLPLYSIMTLWFDYRQRSLGQDNGTVCQNSLGWEPFWFLNFDQHLSRRLLWNYLRLFWIKVTSKKILFSP